MNALIFVCPSCEQRIEVNDPMREAILRSGCPVCASDVAPHNFVPR